MEKTVVCVLAAAGIFVGSAASAEASSADAEAAASLLSQLIRIDTTNPPGDTTELASLLKRDFDALGVPNEVIVAPNGKAAHFFARVEGDGSKEPILLAAHSDVVPVEQAQWSVPAFEGLRKDGLVWGRGALDNKGNLAVFVTALSRIVRNEVPLARDIILLAEADEEQGSYHTSWLEKEHWDKMDAEFTINEGGRTLWDSDGNVRHVGISVVDKLTITFRITASGPTGHSARPLPVDQTANGQLITAMSKIIGFSQPIELGPVTVRYLEALGKSSAAPVADAIENLLTARDEVSRRKHAEYLILLDAQGEYGFAGLLRNTLVVTMIESGVKPNVIPGTASAVMNARLLPGGSVDEFIGAIEMTIDNPRIELKVISASNQPDPIAYYRGRSGVPPSTTDTDLYRAIERSAKNHWPDSIVFPMMLTATTDAVPWREHRVPVYGISATPIEMHQTSGIHGNDERVSVEALGQGVNFVYDVLVDIAGIQ